MRGEATFLIVLLLAGCVEGSDEGFPDAIVTPTPVVDDFDRVADGSVAAPALAIGRAWTYEGFEFYNDDTEFTVVVAEADPDGYLFAGGAEDDLVYDALWASRWYGAHGLSLDRTEFDRPLLRFPLAEGASWQLSDTIALTARAADVDTPLGKDAGFVIEGQDERTSVHVEYSPRAQNIVRLVITSGGAPYDDIRMTRIADAQPWGWYELGAVSVVPNPHEPVVIDVSEGFDSVIASAGGHTGSRARVEGPDGATWEAEFPAEETWKHAMLPATPGKWIAAVAGRPFIDAAPPLPAESPVGWAYMHVAPVTWLRGSP